MGTSIANDPRVEVLGIPRQGTPEWHKARAGKVTGSRFTDVSQNKAGGWGVSAVAYAYELVGARLLLDNPDWKPPHDLKAKPLEWGSTYEPFARTAYILETANDVAEFGFADHPTWVGIGASVDGVIFDGNGLIEIKCPFATREHVRTIHSKKIPSKYVAQVQGNMWVTGRDWCDFISYDPRVAEGLMLAIVRVKADADYIAKLSAKIINFAAFVNQVEKEVRNG